MTTTDTALLQGSAVPVRLDFEALAPGFAKALTALDHAATKELDRAGIEAGLRELVRIRASQLNGCAYCIDMHTADARAAGESERRLYGITAWRDTPYFTDRERAALALCEAVTLMARDHVPDASWEAASAPFDEAEMAALIALIVAINAWNGVGVSTHAWAPGSYQP